MSASRSIAAAVCGIIAALPPAARAALAQGPIPDALVGVWKGTDVPAESRDAVTGAGVALVGWHAQLELAADGRYTWEEYREGELGGCRIATLRRIAGTAGVDGTVLTLAPARAVETKRDGCNRANSYSDRPVAAPRERFGVTLAWQVLISGFETVALTLAASAGSSYTLHYASDPRMDWPAAGLPPRARGDAVPRALPALWAWPARVAPFAVDGVPATFRAPPEDAHWLRLGADGRYEWAGWKDNVVPGPGCAVGILAYERGTYALTVAEYSSQQTLTTEPEAAFVLERRTGCGAEDGERRAAVPLRPSLYTWSIGRTVDNEEVLELKCSDEPRQRNRWQFLLCHWGFEFRTLMARRR